MPEPAYAPALAATALVQQFYARQSSAVVPDPRLVSGVVNAAFWASLRREEGRSPNVSVAMVPPAMTGQPLTFERSLALEGQTHKDATPVVGLFRFVLLSGRDQVSDQPALAFSTLQYGQRESLRTAVG